MSSGILNGNSHLLPVSLYRQSPWIIPCVIPKEGKEWVDSEDLIYPPGGSICTYGYNLFVNDYRGYFTHLCGLPYDNGATLDAEIKSRTESISQGLAVSKQLGSTSIQREIILIPQFYSTDSMKQKIRGKFYTQYDDKISVYTGSFDATGEGESCVPNLSIPVFYLKKNYLDIIDGWIVVEIEKSDGFFPYHMYVGISYGYTTNYPSNLRYNTERKGTIPGVYITGTNVDYDSRQFGALTWYLDEDERHDFYVDNRQYIVMRFHNTPFNLINEKPRGTEGFVVSPPLIGFEDEYRDAVGKIRLYQYGITFGA
ncbi:MAG: hypothetical protein HUK20_06065 [Fibrobacter sp.]|nr:hypothetical protein [Fibrobacter sp.]